jgi:two-component system phosphate regulon sensor histidine kinase PhoR
MPTDYWSVERYRVGIVIGGGILVASLTPYPWTVFIMVLLGYIGWMLHKLHQLQRWLTNGQKTEEMPDSDGAWEQIAYLFHKTQQKSAERKRKQQEVLIRFNQIMAVLPDAAILLDAENHIEWSNKAATKLLGIHPNDRGQRIETLLRNPDLHKFLEANSDDKVKFPSPRDSNMTLRARLLPMPGGARVLNVRDISEGIQLQQTRKMFIANASHELRTPLTVLMGYMELFENDPGLPEYLLGPLQQSREQANRMQQIINDMLALSRLESQEATPMTGNKVDVPSLLNQGIQAIRDTLAGDTHFIEAMVEPDLCVCGSEKDITSVITNLLANAIKHTPAGTHIHILWQNEDDSRACLTVEDDGPGIPEKHLPHLTERFYRVDEGRSRASGGTGLGLAIVKHVMQWHNGNLTITSKPGQTVFRACFPAERVLD